MELGEHYEASREARRLRYSYNSNSRYRTLGIRMTPNQSKKAAPCGRWTALSGRSWPKVSVKEVLNMTNLNVPNTPQTGH